MRIRGLAFVGLVIGAICTQTATAASVPRSAAESQSVDRFFSSDAPESLHESLNQGTVDTPNEWHSEASGWLHAQLSENEREFLSLAVTGTIPNGCATTSTFSTTDATIAVQPTVKFNFPQNTVPSGFAYQFQSDVSNALFLQARIPGNGVNGASANNILIVPTTANGYREYLVTFTILPPYNTGDTVTAGTSYNNFLAAFANVNSGLRSSVSFQNIDLSYCPTATSFAVTATPTTQTPTTTATSTSAPTTTVPTTTRSSTTTATGTTSTPTTTSTTGSTSTTTTVPTTTSTTGSTSTTTSVPTGSSTSTSVPTTSASGTTSVPTTTAGSATTAAGTTAVPTTKVSTTTAVPFCPSHPAACLNGGTCVDGTNGAYSCTCGQGYIGQYCQFSLFPRSKGKKTMGASIPRGVSVARPAAAKQFVKPNQA